MKPMLKCAVTITAVLTLTAGCGLLDSSSPQDDTSPAAGQPVELTTNVDDGATGVTVDTLVQITAGNGTVSSASLKSADGEQNVPGEVTDTGWTATERLEPGVEYQLVASATGTDGEKVDLSSSFTTQNLTLDDQTYPALAPLDGETVGVGMPIIVTFDIPVEDKKTFEQNMHVTSSNQIEGSWNWFSDQEVHFRPKEYWPANTDVSVHLDLNGVPAGNGIYGQQDQNVDFKIGRSAITTIDVDGSKLSYAVDGKVVRTIPVSAGGPGFQTRSGTKVIMEKFDSVDMDAATTGVDSSDPNYYNMKGVQWAMRVTNSGEFLHAAPWNAGRFGVVNASHGCVGMSTADAAWLYERSMRGDVIDFVNSSRGLEDRNGWTDWNVEWEDWTKGSAIPESERVPAPDAPTPTSSPESI